MFYAKRPNRFVYCYNTSRLVVRNGGRVDASTFASGDAGSVTVNASQSVDVSGTVPGSINPSQVTSSANIVDPVLQQALGLPAVPSGASGDVTINTLALRVTDGGLINVRNDGSGDGGTTRINARSIVLDRQGGITAATTTGVGGNISLRAQNLLALNGSTITATAGGTGNGGNLEFNTGTLTALGGSAIAANAFKGRGGNIFISSQGIFRSADSHITAASDLGISGVVQVTNNSLYQPNALVPPASEFVNTQQVVAGSCLARSNALNGVFAVTGNGGLPETPYDLMTLPYELVQVQNENSHLSDMRAITAPATPQTWKLGDPIQPVTDLVVTASGRTLLVAAQTKETIANPQALTCQSLKISPKPN